MHLNTGWSCVGYEEQQKTLNKMKQNREFLKYGALQEHGVQ